MKTRLKVFAAVALIFSLLFTASISNATQTGEIVLVPKTKVPPIIDGELDGVWHNTTEFFCLKNETTPSDDWFDLFGTWRMLWDDENIYLFLYYQDDIFIDTHTNAWEQDGFEFYFDANHLKQESFDGYDDIQIRFNHWNKTYADITYSFCGGPQWNFSPQGIEFKTKNTIDNLGWNLEVKIPMANIKMIPAAETEFGFEVQQNDNDGLAREHVAKWWSSRSDSWKNPEIWGTCRLWELEVDERLPVLKIQERFTPTIDGQMEGEWLQYPEFNCNTWVYDWPDIYFDFSNVCQDWTDHRFHFRLICNDTKLFCFLKRWDDILVDAHQNSWEQDGFEFYFDGDNSKLAGGYDQVNDVQMRINRWYQTNNDILWNFGEGGGTDWGLNRNGLEFKVADKDEGFDIEFSIPLSDLQIDPSIDSEFGFDIQSNENDSDHRDNVRRWWWHDDNSWRDASLFGTAVITNIAISNLPLPPFASSEDETQKLTDNCYLNQNYPNPFNPITTIPYSVGKTSHVKLAVYDLLGKEIALLVDELKPGGEYTAVFNAQELTNGVYFYKLWTGENILTRKMTLLK